MKYEDESGYIDPIEYTREFNVVAMTKIYINRGSGVKGENFTITGSLKDDLDMGVPGKDINLHWMTLRGELMVNGVYDSQKLKNKLIGNVTTDSNGNFNLTTSRLLNQEMNVGQIYILGIFKGTDVYIKSESDEVVFDISAHTHMELNEESRNKRLIRGVDFNINGTIVEEYQTISDTDSKVVLNTLTDADQMELYLTNIEKDIEVPITDITVNYKSEGGFTLSGIVPHDLEVGSALLRLVFKGSVDGRYLGDQFISFHKVWANTQIYIEEPEFLPKEKAGVVEGYYLYEDLAPDKYNASYETFVKALTFKFQLLEWTEGGDPKPIADGEIRLMISAPRRAFSNTTIGRTDENGYVNFTFDSTLTHSNGSWAIEPEDVYNLVIVAEFTGSSETEYYLPSKTLPIETTHLPVTVDVGKKGWDKFMDEYGWLIWTVVAIVIVFLVVFFFAMQWYTKQMRIRGMRRIIKRAADQLIAGNEYTAVIFKSYQKLGVHLRKYGYLRRDSETFREFEDAVRSALPIDRMSMDQFLQLLEEARYSSHQIGENQRNDAILNLRAIERSLNRILVDEDSAVRALERLETEGVKETKIVVGGQVPPKPQGPQLLKRQPEPPKLKK
jgi:hypothetical protein